MLKAGPGAAHPALDARKNPVPEGTGGNSAPRKTRTDGAGGAAPGPGGPAGAPGDSAGPERRVLGRFGKKVAPEFVFPTAAGNGGKGELLP